MAATIYRTRSLFNIPRQHILDETLDISRADYDILKGDIFGTLVHPAKVKNDCPRFWVENHAQA